MPTKRKLTSTAASNQPNKVQRTRQPAEDQGLGTHSHAQNQRLDDLAQDFLILRAQNENHATALGEIQDRFASLESRIIEVLENQRPTSRSQTPGPGPIGIDPYSTIRTQFSWVDDSTIDHIAKGILDFAHLIKLVPSEDRPKGQLNAGLPTTFT